MKILICDDQQEVINNLKTHISDYIKTHCIKADIITSTSSKEIYGNNDVFNLAFLDIQMDDVNGLSLAKELKKRNSNIIIFFVTDYKEFQDTTMDLHIFRFFEKPFDVQRLYSGLDKAMEYLNETYVDIFLYNNGSHIKLLIDDIIYIKRENRKIIVVSNKGDFVVSQNLDYWEDKLPNTFFYQVHKSFLVNLHYVTKYSYTELFLNDTIRIPIASRKQANFHKYWFIYLTGR